VRVQEFTGLYRDELASGRDPFTPLGCVEDPDGRLVLYDGWHRIEARRRIVAELPGRGYNEVAVEVVRGGEREAVDLAYELAIDCSAIGAKQLTLAERVAAAKRLSEIRSDLPAREIARRLGISHPTVLRARGSIKVTGGGGSREPPLDHPSLTTRTELPRSRQSARGVTLEQRAWRLGTVLSQFFEQALEESRGMLSFGTPNLTRAGAAAYKALQRAYGEDAPAVADDLVALATAMRDQAAKVSQGR
jgi:hypothetical protein